MGAYGSPGSGATGSLRPTPLVSSAPCYLWEGGLTRDGRVWESRFHPDVPPLHPEDPDVGPREWVSRHFFTSLDPVTGAIDSVALGTVVHYGAFYPQGTVFIPFAPLPLSALDPAGAIWTASSGEVPAHPPLARRVHVVDRGAARRRSPRRRGGVRRRDRATGGVPGGCTKPDGGQNVERRRRLGGDRAHPQAGADRPVGGRPQTPLGATPDRNRSCVDIFDAGGRFLVTDSLEVPSVVRATVEIP